MTWRPRLLLARMAALDQAGDHRDVAEGALQHGSIRPSTPRDRRPACPRRTARPCRATGSQAPDGEHIVGGDEAQAAAARRAPCAGSAACPASGARCGPRSNRRRGTACCRAGKLSTSRPSRSGSTERRRWMLQPFAHLGGQQDRQRAGLGQQCRARARQDGGQRQAAAAIGRHLGRIAAARGEHSAVISRDALEAQHARRRRRRCRRAPGPG